MQAGADTLAALAQELADCPGLHLIVCHPHQFGARGDVRSKSVAVQQRFNAGVEWDKADEREARMAERAR